MLAGPVNRTIDDYFADSVTGRQVEYTGYWNVGQTCYGCAIHPDANKAYAGTWHDVTSNYPNTSIADYLTIQFKGAATGTDASPFKLMCCAGTAVAVLHHG